MVTHCKWLVPLSPFSSYFTFHPSLAVHKISLSDLHIASSLPQRPTRTFCNHQACTSVRRSTMSYIPAATFNSDGADEAPFTGNELQADGDDINDAKILFRKSDWFIGNFAPVARIMKIAVPDNAKIAKEAKECMQECVSEFISFITSEGKFVSPREAIIKI